MCGIAGVFSYGANGAAVDRGELQAMSQSMRERGPDGVGEWLSADAKLGLVHRRLSIIDLSAAGAQPMVDAESGLVLVFNGEIYNYKDLRDELLRDGVVFRSHSDSEVLLKLYARLGTRMLRRLRGMFAFAIWDARAGELFIARDPLGIKPLYIADDGRSLRFASQVRALLTCRGLRHTASAAGRAGFLLWGHVPEPFTLYREIRSLPAGGSLRIFVGGNRQSERYFDLSEELRAVPDSVTPAQQCDAAEQLRGAIRDSIRSHLVADVPVGLFLSAGLDSVTIASHVASQNRSDLRALTLGFEEYRNTVNDEVPLAANAASALGAHHDVHWIAKADFARELNTLLAAMDQPSIDGVNSYFVSRAARESGLKVALSGLGGDELFAGYSSFSSVPRLVRLLRPWSRLPGLSSAWRRACQILLQAGTSPKVAGLLEYGGDFAGAYLLRRALYLPSELTTLLGADVAQQGLEELDTMAALRSTIADLRDDRRRVMALETSWYMRNQLLRDTDWASMAHSVEVRVPFVDVPLLRAVVALMANHAAPGKQDMAATMPRTVPKQLLSRPKTGFSIPVRQWLLAGKSGQAGARTADRGLRGWALHLYRHFTGEALA